MGELRGSVGGLQEKGRKRGGEGSESADHGQAMMAVLAILKPKLVPGREIGEKGLGKLGLVALVEGLWPCDRGGAPGGGRDERDRRFVVELEVDEIFGVGDAEGHELGRHRWLLERHGDVKLHEVVWPLFHPVIRHRAEIDDLAAVLECGEIADVGEAAGVLPGERGELFALDELARFGESLRRERRIHLVEHPVVHHRGDLAVGGEVELAPHRHPNVRVGGRRGYGREREREPERRRPSFATQTDQRISCSTTRTKAPRPPLAGKVRRPDGGRRTPLSFSDS